MNEILKGEGNKPNPEIKVINNGCNSKNSDASSSSSEVNGCIDNLHICKASCCKVFSAEVRCLVNSPREDYYKKRGMNFQRLNREFISMVIPHTCQHLTEDFKCGLHGTPQKPLLCQQLNEKTAKSGRFMLTEGCIYG